MKDKPLVIALFIAMTHTALTAAPTISATTRSPASPTNNDSVTVTANVQPSAGGTVPQVQLTYSTGAVTAGTVFRETMGATPSATSWNGTGAQNPWTATAIRAAGDVKQRASNANHTTPVVLTNCTTDGTTRATCASTASIWPGMTISGANIAASTTISSITDASTLVLSTAATGSGTALSLTAAGVTLTNCISTIGSPNVSCDSTVGLVAGMGVSGPNGAIANPAPTVLSITDTHNFVLSGNVTTVATPLTASGCGMEFSTGDTNYTDTMATTTTPINAGGATAGYVEFFVRTSDFVSNNGWNFQISPDGGTTWNTRLSESYTANTVSLTNCTLNATTTVTCASTAGLTAGMTVQGAALRFNNCGTTNTSAAVTCPDTTGLAVGMYVTGNGIANGTRVLSFVTNTSFAMSANVTATATVSVLANYLNANTTISSVTNTTTFVLNAAPAYSGGGLALDATTINHGFALRHYDLASADRTSNMKMRFQFSGYSAVNPARIPICDIDDIIAAITASSTPAAIAMFDDGAHGDGAAGDGIFGAVIPLSPTGTTVTYGISATDNLGGNTSSGTASYTVVAASPSLIVTSASQLSATGNAGGPFTPSSITYTVFNNGVGSMNWTASKTASWLTLSASGGTLAAGASATITATINTNANSLLGGSYSDTAAFANTSNGVGNTTRGVNLTTYSIPSAPVLPAVAAFARGTNETISWAAVAGATSYTLQISATANFSSVLSTQTVTNPPGGFINLTEGVTYYYRVIATNPAGSSAYSNVVAVTQDATPPHVAITSPVSGTSTSVSSITVAGTSSDSLSGIAAVTINNVPATTSNGFATWSATVPLGFGSNGITATATDNAGNGTTTVPVVVTLTTAQTYNPLYIPNTITGTTFNLTLDQKTKQFLSGPATTTYGYNGALFWGPTLIMNKGDVVQMHVTNNLIDTTTTHWHGFHIPSIMDGGPHQTIPPGTTWSPTFTVLNNAGTFWYHPHLHTTTQQQLTMGAGGLIIIKDPQEAALNLPRTYGVDDFPIILTSRRFQTTAPNVNQFVTANSDYGDVMFVNGTLNPQVSLPAQMVRLRILDAEIERAHTLGFTDGRTFYVIATDGGLVNAPIPVTRVRIDVGERLEILVNLTGVAPGTAFDLRSYNSGQLPGYPGGQAFTAGAIGSLLNNIDFNDLHIVVAAPTANPVTTMPTTMANNVFWTMADVTRSRSLTISAGSRDPVPHRQPALQ